jgi:NAD(P)-dependent dehydrogenase (short-subunit alcohol dehydrogenase family)
VSDEQQVEALMAHAASTFGSIDVLHNNAAALGPDMLGQDGDLLSTTAETWDRTFSITLRGQWLCARHAVPYMLSAGRGSIVNMSSGTSLGGDRVRIAYSAAKAGVNSLTRSIATMYGKQGVRCNAIAAGFVLSPPARAQVPPRDLLVYQDNCLTPELGTPEDLAAVVVFLASDEARYITGQVISADGGSFSHLGTLAAFRQLARQEAGT